jgi:hypothetical protein
MAAGNHRRFTKTTQHPGFWSRWRNTGAWPAGVLRRVLHGEACPRASIHDRHVTDTSLETLVSRLIMSLARDKVPRET